MLKIRLQRIGRKNDSKFRIVLIKSERAPKSGAFSEILGFYDPKTKSLTVKKDRIEYWRGKGVQISPVVSRLVKKGK